MINTVTYNIVLRKDAKDKRGLMPVVLQAFVNQKRVVIPIGFKVLSADFDQKRQIIKGSCQHCEAYNEMIRDAVGRTVKIHADANIKNIHLNADNFRDRFTNTLNDYSFIQFWQQELDARLKDGSIERSTYKQQLSCLNALKGFKSVVTFDMLTPGFLEKYEAYLRRVKKLDVNTISVRLKSFKAYVNRAILKEICTYSPFIHYKIKRGEAFREFLTFEQVKELIKVYDARDIAPHLQVSLHYLLIMIFTGLRVSDVKKLHPSSLKKLVIGQHLVIEAHKTRRYNKVVRIKLYGILERLINDLKAYPDDFKLKTDQRMNDDLKIVGGYAGIKDKNMSTKIGRHTFGTLFLKMGGQAEKLQQLFKHGDIETTMIYTHLAEDDADEQLINYYKAFE